MNNDERNRELFNEAFLEDFDALLESMTDEEAIDYMNGCISSEEIDRREREARGSGQTVMTGYVEVETGKTTVYDIALFLESYNDAQMPTLFTYGGKTYLGVACLTKTNAKGIDNPLNWEVIA